MALILANATRTADATALVGANAIVNSSAQIARWVQGLQAGFMLCIDVTAWAGGGTLTPTIMLYDDGSAAYVDFIEFGTIGGTGFYFNIARQSEPVAAGKVTSVIQRNLPFMDFQLPKAVIALKQGAGRLIRDVKDSGVLMICDPRLIA